MNKPNLFLIGAAKCSTTSLAKTLSVHPDIFVPDVKEPHHFDLDDRLYAGNLEKYASLYRKKANELYSLDATPSYISYPGVVIERMVECVGIHDVKIIAVLREPANRAYSHYMHLVRARGITTGFGELIEKDYKGIEKRSPATWMNIFSDGLYGKHLTDWNSTFADNIQVCLYEDLISHTESTMRSICANLGIQYIPEFSRLRKENVMTAARFPGLARFISSENNLKKMAKKLIRSQNLRKGIVRRIKEKNKKTIIDRKAGINKCEIDKLKSLYSDDVAKLGLMFPDLDIEKKWGYGL